MAKDRPSWNVFAYGVQDTDSKAGLTPTRQTYHPEHPKRTHRNQACTTALFIPTRPNSAGLLQFFPFSPSPSPPSPACQLRHMHIWMPKEQNWFVPFFYTFLVQAAFSSSHQSLTFGPSMVLVRDDVHPPIHCSDAGPGHPGYTIRHVMHIIVVTPLLHPCHEYMRSTPASLWLTATSCWIDWKWYLGIHGIA